MSKESSSGNSEIKDIFRRMIHRDFSGNTGDTIKNSFYQSNSQRIL